MKFVESPNNGRRPLLEKLKKWLLNKHTLKVIFLILKVVWWLAKYFDEHK